MTRAKEIYLNFEKKAREFLYTDAYILLVLAIVLIAWLAQNSTFGFVALILVSCVALVVSDDIIPLTVNIFGAPLMIFDDSVSSFVYLWPTFIPLVLAIAVFVVRNVKNKIARKKFVMGKMFFPQICVSIALLLGGAGIVEKSNYLDALPICIALGIGVLFVYLLYCNFAKTENNIDVYAYFAKVLMFIGVAVGIELVALIVRTGVSPSGWSAYGGWNTGWGNRNNVATFLLICAPMGIYLSTKRRFPIVYILISMFEYACLIMTLSRGGILFGAIAGIFALFFSIVKANDRKKQIISWAVVVVAAGVVLAIFKDLTAGVVESILNRVNVEGDYTSGRFDLYREAWKLFKQYPIVGGGMGHVGTNAGMKNDMGLYWFHSTLFQILGCMGLVGVLAYGYYYATKIYLLIKKRKSTFALFILAIWIGFEGYSMIDTGTMTPFPNMMLIMITTYMLEITEVGKSECPIVGMTEDTYKNAIYRRELPAESTTADNPPA